MARPTVEQAAQIAERRTKVYELRIAGVDDVTIGRQLTSDKVPGGYSPKLSDDAIANAVRQDVSRGFKARQRRVDTVAGDLAELIEQRLERLFRAAAPQAYGGSAPHILAAVRVLDRLARLRGTDAPLQLDLTVTDEETREIREAVGELIAEVHATGSVVDPDDADAL